MDALPVRSVAGFRLIVSLGSSTIASSAIARTENRITVAVLDVCQWLVAQRER
jgi:hypothetical protein